MTLTKHIASATRRSALALGAATLGGFALQGAATPAMAKEDGRYASAVDEGLAYLSRRASKQQALARTLTEAIRSGNLDRAREAYVASRPPYEEIEVLAASFAERDAAIDARPYAFERGETDEAFMGFHKIEALLFRDNDAATAVPVARQLERSLESLVDDLAARENFSARKTFAGLLALSTEIAAKKISSEEETWSDRSLLIFRHNLIGIESQYRPFAAEVRRRDRAHAQTIDEAYAAAREAVAQVYGDEPGGALYSAVGTGRRRAISDTTYRYRDALARARDVLELKG